ncbi:MAG TPA: succinate dehydrogenase, hydrophobic membrane anchor protein [Alphaproteobacteria bacterium]|mgnify:CR=1 FL=1|nr:succinate dehydrogenase, hydrophobic membrane anchor protein [Alphaproteobacteria bacterium]
MYHRAARLQTPLSRARGMGSARDGVGRWISMRVSAVGNALLVLWFGWFVMKTAGMEYDSFRAALGAPINAVPMILCVLSALWHGTLGLREIIEDYIHCEALKIAKLIGLYLGAVSLAVACVFSILLVALG